MALMVALFYALNHYHPMAGDDYSYSFIKGTTERVQSLADAVWSQRVEWRAWNGRPLANGLAQCFLMHDKVLFNVANTLALLAMVAAVLWLLAQRALGGKWVAASVVLALFLLAVPAPGETLMWLDGSCNNLWLVLLLTVFLACALSPFWQLQLLALLLAPFAGSAHEGISIGLAGFLFAYTLLRGKRASSFLHYLIIALVLAGLVIRFHSPGLYHRVGVHEADLNVWATIYDKFILNNKIWPTLRSLAEDGWHLSCPYAAACLMLLLSMVTFCFRLRHRLDSQNRLAVCFALAALLQAIAILCSGILFERVWMGVFFFAFLSLLVYLVPAIQTWGKGAQVCLAALLCALALGRMLSALPASIAHHKHADTVIASIKAGESVIEVPNHHIIPGSQPWFYEMRCGANCLYWANKEVAQYYGTGHFSVLTAEEHALLQSVSPELISQAKEGLICRLPNGYLLLATPQGATGVSINFPGADGASRELKPCIVWPLGSQYGVIIDPREAAFPLIITCDLPDGQKHQRQYTEASE